MTETGAKRRKKEPQQTTHDANVINGTLALESQLVRSRKSLILRATDVSISCPDVNREILDQRRALELIPTETRSPSPQRGGRQGRDVTEKETCSGPWCKSHFQTCLCGLRDSVTTRPLSYCLLHVASPKPKTKGHQARQEKQRERKKHEARPRTTTTCT